MPRPRGRHLSPGIFGVNSLDPDSQTGLVVIEIKPLAGFRELALYIAGTLERVVPDRHPIADIVREQCEPFAELPVIQKLSFGVIEIFDVLAQRISHFACSAVRSSFSPAASSPNSYTGSVDYYR